MRLRERLRRNLEKMLSVQSVKGVVICVLLYGG